MDSDAAIAAAQSSIHCAKAFFSVCRDLVALRRNPIRTIASRDPICRKSQKINAFLSAFLLPSGQRVAEACLFLRIPFIERETSSEGNHYQLCWHSSLSRRSATLGRSYLNTVLANGPEARLGNVYPGVFQPRVCGHTAHSREYVGEGRG